jgi:autoinducer 2 (AI-2) kinase
MGTGNSRVALTDSDGNILGIRTFNNVYYRDNSYEDAQYFKPDEWQKSLLQGCDELCQQFPNIQIDAISAAGARQSFVLIDAHQNSFFGLPNIDNRGRAYMNDVPNHQAIYHISGKWATEDFGAAKIMGLKKIYPDMYEKIDQFTSLSEWIGWIFTGKTVMEYSQASETQMYDTINKEWSHMLCECYGLEMRILPPLCASGTLLGPISAAMRKRFHIADDGVFVVGGADTQTALKQTDIQEGEIAIVSGTTSPVVAIVKDNFYDHKERVWVDAGLGGSNYQIEMNPGVTGMNYQRIKNQMFSDISYGELEKMYKEKKHFSCTAAFTSLLFYEKKSLRHGGFLMRSPLQDDLKKEDLIYAVLADIGCSINEELSLLIELTNAHCDYLLGCAGGFQSDALCHMIADLSGKELHLKEGYSQATVQGLISICNGSLKQETKLINRKEIIYQPEQGTLIQEYNKQWSENRHRLFD